VNPNPSDPADPITPTAEMASATVEMYNSFVAAGMPPMAAAVMLGQWMAAVGSSGTDSEKD